MSFPYLNVNESWPLAGTLFCGSGCPFSVSLLVFNLLFMSREHWFSFERKGNKFDYLPFIVLMEEKPAISNTK